MLFRKNVFEYFCEDLSWVSSVFDSLLFYEELDFVGRFPIYYLLKILPDVNDAEDSDEESMT